MALGCPIGRHDMVTQIDSNDRMKSSTPLLSLAARSLPALRHAVVSASSLLISAQPRFPHTCPAEVWELPRARLKNNSLQGDGRQFLPPGGSKSRQVKWPL